MIRYPVILDLRVEDDGSLQRAKPQQACDFPEIEFEVEISACRDAGSEELSYEIERVVLNGEEVRGGRLAVFLPLIEGHLAGDPWFWDAVQSDWDDQVEFWRGEFRSMS